MNRLHQTTASPRAHVARGQLVRTIGPWQLVRKLGEGTWTDVYLARPTSSASEDTADYVLKILKPDRRDDPTAIKLLQREVFISKQVRHPHLSSILSAHTDNVPRFVVMPYVEGTSAAAALKEAERFVVPHALWLARQTAEALQALHQGGWLHGDVKPANVIVSANGHTTLVDLGLARPIDARRSPEEEFTGSLAYACPEAFHGNLPFGPAGDVYSLGITLYELITGSRPFQAEDPTELAACHLTSNVPDPRLVVPQLLPRVSRLLSRMLAKDPLRRPTIPELIEWLVDLEIETFAERPAA